MKATGSEARLRELAFFKALSTGSKDAVELVIGPGFDVDCCHPQTGATALQHVASLYIAALPVNVMIGKMFAPVPTFESLRALARWLVSRGANPDRCASSRVAQRTSIEFDADYLHNPRDSSKEYGNRILKLPFHGESARSVLAEFLVVLMSRASIVSNANGERDNCNAHIALINAFLDEMNSARAHVLVDSAVVDFWTEMCLDESKHDLVLVSSDGESTTSSSMLASASPVVAALLASGMSDARQRITTKQTPETESHPKPQIPQNDQK
eukprot:606084-Amphidinium_carterae.1